ncbi:uncharacterized protein TNCV_3753731 [Trichonephila clavipes]|nr:uncharacterized protein TNCV_3753731 [Trichonephila clavipes]
MCVNDPYVCLFGLGALGKIKSQFRFAWSELRCLPLWRKLGVKINCCDWYPPIGEDSENVEDDKRSGLPQTPRAAENIKKSSVAIRHCTLEFIPEGGSGNKELYVDILRRLRKSTRKKRLKLWTVQTGALLHDNAPAHRSLFVTDFLAKTKKAVLSHPPYCDFSLFPVLAWRLQHRRFQSVDEVKNAFFL